MRWVPLLFVSLLLAGCQLNAFDVQIAGETTVPGSNGVAASQLAALPQIGEFSEIDFADNADLQHENVTLEDINLAKVNTVTLQIASPKGQGFDFLDDVSLYAKSGDQEVLVAQKQGIATLALGTNSPTLELETTGADLTPYVTAASMSLELRGHGRTPPQDVKLKVNVDFEFRVKVF